MERKDVVTVDVYDRIDQVLKEKGVSRRKAAQMAGIVPGSLNSALYRKKGLSAASVSALAQTLGVDADYLLKGEVSAASYNKALNTLSSTIALYQSYGFKFHKLENDNVVITDPKGVKSVLGPNEWSQYGQKTVNGIKEYAFFLHFAALDEIGQLEPEKYAIFEENE